MEQEMQSRFALYIEAFNEARELAYDGQVAAGIVEQLRKDNRAAQIHAERHRTAVAQNAYSLDADGERLATPKQLGYLKRLGVKVKGSLTREAASALIDDALAEQAA